MNEIGSISVKICDDEPELSCDEIKSWADGIIGALGTENASKLTEREIRLATYILKSEKVQISRSD